jgi:hypothetical protein
MVIGMANHGILPIAPIMPARLNAGRHPQSTTHIGGRNVAGPLKIKSQGWDAIPLRHRPEPNGIVMKAIRTGQGRQVARGQRDRPDGTPPVSVSEPRPGQPGAGAVTRPDPSMGAGAERHHPAALPVTPPPSVRCCGFRPVSGCRERRPLVRLQPGAARTRYRERWKAQRASRRFWQRPERERCPVQDFRPLPVPGRTASAPQARPRVRIRC